MRLAILLLSLSTAVLADDLIHEDFTKPTLPAGWSTGGRANSWAVADGVLQGTCANEDDHGPAVFAPLKAHNVHASWRMKLDAKGNCLALIDGESAFGGAAHLLRVSVYGSTLTLAQDRGTPQSHLDQAADKAKAKKAGKPVPPPTVEQLADPKFYRTERLASAPLAAKPGEWIAVDVVLKGNDVTVTINGTQKLIAKGTVFDVEKSRLVFLVGQGKKVWIDDVHVSAL